MPFFYVFLLLILMYFEFKGIIQFRIWYVPISTFFIDVFENIVSLELIKKLSNFKEMRIINFQYKEIFQKELSIIISSAQIKILLFSILKWLLILIVFLILLRSFSMLLLEIKW